MATTTVVETYPNGDKYEGQVGVDGVKCGWGKYTFANGKVYEGHWAGGKMNGWGEFMEGDTKDRFIGEWDDANRRFGIYFYANGDMYQGGFERSMKHGRGIIWENKVMYEATYNRDKLVSKVPWKVKMAEQQSPVRRAASPVQQHPSSASYPPPQNPNPALEAELQAARARVMYLEEKGESQETQLMLLTKELRAMQAENDMLRTGANERGGMANPMSREPRPATVTPRQKGASAGSRGATPTGRSSSRGGGRAAANGVRSRSSGGSSRQPGPAIGPRRQDKTSSVIYKKTQQPHTFDRMSPNKLREEFRYYYNHFDEK